MNVYFLLSLLCILLGLTSCGKQPQKKDRFVRKWHEQEARLYDIPVPVGAIPFVEQNDSGGIDEQIISFSVSAQEKDIFDFYLEQMERIGWKCTAMVRAHESFLFFAKPNKWCSISLRPQKNDRQLKIIIFYGIKE